MTLSIWHLLLLGLGLRLALLLYGTWQDRSMAVKFTDVDYYVFHDAAEYITKGQSPYLRATYRYSPLLAIALQPNIHWTVHFGKFLFILFDLLTGYLLYKILQSKQSSQTLCLTAAGLWLFNPLSSTVSVRGNAESVMSFLVLMCVKFLIDGQIFAAGLLYALSIHFKIYPVTYAVAIYLFLGESGCHGNKDTRGEGHWHGDMVNRLRQTVAFLIPNRNRLVFSLSSAVMLTVLTGLFYIQYGWEFLYETYLYHVTRKDIRHNFSVYFYMLYLQTKGGDSTLLGLLAFIPQVVLLVIFSLKYYKDLPLVFFLNTFAFVTFNKVCTSQVTRTTIKAWMSSNFGGISPLTAELAALERLKKTYKLVSTLAPSFLFGSSSFLQYFFWYLSLLPLLLGNLNMSKMRAGVSVVMWFLGQGLWLLPAYYLEFEGQNTYFWIWLAGLLFFSINLYIMYVVEDSYQWLPWKHKDSAKLSTNHPLRRTPLGNKRFEKYLQKKDKVS